MATNIRQVTLSGLSPDWDLNEFFFGRINGATGNVAITITTNNKRGGILYFIQDSTGSRTLTINGTSISVDPDPDALTRVDISYAFSTYAFITSYGSGGGGSDPGGGDTPTALLFTTRDGGLQSSAQVFTGNSPDNNGWNNRGLDALSIPASTTGIIYTKRHASDAYGYIMALDTTNALQDYSAFDWGVYVQNSAGNLYKVQSGTPTDASVTVAVNDFVGLRRIGGTGVITIVSSPDEVNWTDIVTLTGTSTAQLYAVMNVNYEDAKMYYPKILLP